MTETANSTDFLALVRKSNLVEEPTLTGFLAHLDARGGVPAQPSALAEALIAAGHLTPFQARQLLQGKFRGFFINSKYRLLELIAVGGMGAVYLCEHVLLQRLVAIKILKDLKQLTSAPDRFIREARAVAALDHVNIVRAFDLDRLGSAMCLVMEYVDGVSLQTLVTRRGPLPVPRAAQAAAQVALGLQHAHEAGWVHRDIKPGNLLLSRQGVVKVLDMGLARLFDNPQDNLTAQHDNKAILGTADYIAPEQALNSTDVDIRADVYSLGATLYFMLAGRPPFNGGTMAQKIIWHQTSPPPPLTQVRPGVPGGLAQVVERMMAKSPADRYQTPAEAAQALQPWAGGPVITPDDGDVPRPCPALVKYMTEPTGRPPMSGVYGAASRRPGSLPDMPSLGSLKTGPDSTASQHDVDLMLQGATTWRGRPLTDTPAPRSGALPRAVPGGAPAAPGLWAKWGTPAMAAGLLGSLLTIGAVIAYQANKPSQLPAKTAGGK